MTSTSRIIDYVGAGTAAGRPAAPSVPTGGAAVYVATDTHVVTVYDGSAWQNVTAGAEYVNAQTGTTYTVVTGDVGKLVTFSNAASIAVTLPHATVAGFGAGFFFDAVNLGAGTVTITPTTSTIDGAATITLTTNQGIRVVSDGTNYFTVRGRAPTSGTVTSVGSGTGLTGGPVTGSGTLSLAAIANHDLLANTSGGSAAPVATTLTALIDDAIGSTQGDILYRNATVWTVLAPGTNGNVLTTGGAAANPAWAPVSAGSGTVTKVSTGTGLTGGDITATGTVSLAAIANHDLLANTSGGSAAPIATTLTAFIDDALGSTQGDILYRNATVWTVLAPGSSGNVLTSGGAGANVSWGAAGGAGTVTSIVAGTGLSGGTITSSGTVALAAIADGDVLANTSGSSAAPVATTVTALLDKGIASTQGDIAYRNATTWVALAPGSAGQVLQSGGAAANPAWASTVTVNSYTSSGAVTWNKPAGCTTVYVVVVGSGGGGGAGVGAAAGSARQGGAGGGGGGRNSHMFRASDLTGSVTVTVGAGGIGGTGTTGAGPNGGAGNDTTFGAYITGYAGGGGAGGPTSTAVRSGGSGAGVAGDGTTGSGSSTQGGAPSPLIGSAGIGGQGAGGPAGSAGTSGENGGGAGGGTTAVNTAQAGLNGGGSVTSAGGGGSGGGVTAASPGTAGAAGAGGSVGTYSVGTGPGGGGLNGNAGQGTPNNGDSTKCGQGGAGGGANNAATGGAGTNGGSVGGGGGGGGGGTSTGGNGGNGGDGACFVFAW